MEGGEESRPLLHPGGDYAHRNDSTESDTAYRKRILSLRVILFTNFLSAVGFSALAPTLWPYLQRMGGSKAFLGYIVGAFSFGQLLGAPFWGYWFNYYQTRTILLITILLRIVGNLGYAFAGSVTGDNEWFLFEVRFVVGLGAGAMAVCNAYTAEATTSKERTAAMANISASGSLGFVIGPVLAVCFGQLKPGIVIGHFVFDYLTATAYMAALLALINAVFLLFWFEDHRIKLPKLQNSAGLGGGVAKGGSVNGSVAGEALKPYRDGVPLLVALVCYFSAMVTFSAFETVGTPMMMDEYALNAQQGSIYSGIIGAVGGFICIFVFIAAKMLVKRYSERQILVAGILGVIIGCVVFIPFTGSPPKIWTPSDDDDISSAEGCRGEWCDKLPKLSLAQYIVGITILNLTYPLAAVMCFSIFSKALGPFPQGLWMGFINSVGSFSRGLGPFAISSLYAQFGPRIVFIVVAGLNMLALLLAMVAYRRLIPHELFRIGAAK